MNSNWRADDLVFPPGHVHLWFSRPSDIRDPTLLAAYQAMIAPEELERGRRFRFDRDRHRHLITRALVRTVLSRYAPVPPQEWRFVENRFGRPFIAGTQACRGLTFNISHSNDLVAMAVGRNLRIGIDVESIGRVRLSVDIADRFFAASEASDVQSLCGPSRERRFLEYWTLKEAYVKARGRGLSLPMDGFAFEVADSRIHFRVQPGQDRRADRWRFAQYRYSAEYVAAVCADPPPDAPLRMSMREAVPLVSCRMIDLPVLRTSPAELSGRDAQAGTSADPRPSP